MRFGSAVPRQSFSNATRKRDAFNAAPRAGGASDLRRSGDALTSVPAARPNISVSFGGEAITSSADAGARAALHSVDKDVEICGGCLWTAINAHIYSMQGEHAPRSAHARADAAQARVDNPVGIYASRVVGHYPTQAVGRDQRGEDDDAPPRPGPLCAPVDNCVNIPVGYFGDPIDAGSSSRLSDLAPRDGGTAIRAVHSHVDKSVDLVLADL